MKENIQKLSGNSCDILKNINPVKFDYKSVGNLPKSETDKLCPNYEAQRTNKVGFLAQDVQKIYPEAVFYDSIDDQYYLDYMSFTPLLVNAFQEQQLIIESLQSQLSNINTLLVKESNLKSIAASSEEYSAIEECILYQNALNLFSQETKIKYKVPFTSSDASIILHDMTGKQLKSYELEYFGESSINIYSSELIAGMYMYSLLVDGSIIDTKQMIITD